MKLPEYAYFKGEIVPYAEAKVGILTHALNYGTGVFGGVRAYKNDDNGKLYLFRPYDHYKRFLNSCKMML
ncbi:MAG: branched chain amino acid aminotransferase, partial [Anaerolineae bacterium]|nr:branched chain amino acid aminotransferase [Anaerolineae bacterium]